MNSKELKVMVVRRVSEDKNGESDEKESKREMKRASDEQSFYFILFYFIYLFFIFGCEGKIYL
jgi:hypothetical protein